MKNNVFDSAVNDIRLHVFYSGYCRCDPSWQTEELATAFCRLYIPESGGGILRCGEETVEMIPGFAYLLPPEVPVSYCCPEQMEKLFFHLSFFSPDHYDLFFGCSQILRFPLPESRLAEYVKLYHSQSYYSCIKLKQLLWELLLNMYQQLPAAALRMPTYSRHVRETVDYIHRNLSARLTVGELAKQQYISCTTLNKYFREELGVTVGRYMDDQILMQAKALLCHTGDSITEISSRLGFNDPFYFSNKFKAQSGFTPREYRKLHTNRGSQEK